MIRHREVQRHQSNDAAQQNEKYDSSSQTPNGNASFTENFILTWLREPEYFHPEEKEIKLKNRV